jgi:hypothetical protein
MGMDLGRNLVTRLSTATKGRVDNVLQQYLRFNGQMIQAILPEKSDKILLGIGGLGS